MTKLTIGHRRIFIPLHVLAPGNERLAKMRASAIERDCYQGVISEPVRKWLGERAARRIEEQLDTTRPNAIVPMGGWAEAIGRYLSLYPVVKTSTEGRVSQLHPSNTDRHHLLGRFKTWAIESGQVWGSPFEDIVTKWIAYRNEMGIKPNTQRRQITWVYLFADWLHDQGLLREPLNRRQVTRRLPKATRTNVELPAWESDVATLRLLHGRRHERSADNNSYWAVWLLFLITRGLGCRPSEASSLCWPSVDLERGVVRVLGTKESRGSGDRQIPILFKWVHDGLSEAAARRRSDTGPVCESTLGTAWTHQSIAAKAVTRVMKLIGHPSITLKPAQKLHIMQLINMGFPAHVVASWTGHTLSVQERHYCEAGMYLGDKRDYAEFGVLTTLGEERYANTRNSAYVRL